ncbi:mediator complex, subunit Med18 [Daldinia caldariorum]|uniref:mediator complex, subunit Med18 n=1 Tax=Daldinia caldariorum TaxID=326644 RepID=UPI0020079C2C|nr:mediator complex, subunit Med18 [Daldinia caldariorum]KAI1471296.1 mediator complex, subunit Med18 [Daldinia caldariorum]
MKELFLTASVKDSDFAMACAVLQGLTWMKARHAVHRILFFHGQPQPRPLKVTRAFQQSRFIQLWKDLSIQLSRCSYVIQLAYEVLPDRDFGKETNTDFNSLPGTLRWTDLPDPLRDTPVTQRKKIEIPDQGNLPTALTDNGIQYKNEMIQESYSFVRENVEFVFSRYYRLPLSDEELGNKPEGRPRAALPPWADLRPVDPAQKWVLNVKLNVMEDSQPEKVKKANGELLAVKAELEKIFDFKAVDRRVFDTRIEPPPPTFK